MNVIFKILFNEVCQHFEDLCYSLNQYFPDDLCGGCSVAQSCLTLYNPVDCSMPGLPVPHHLLKFAQVHTHCISDVIQPSHLLIPSSPALRLSQHQWLFQWVSCSYQMTKILELQLQHQSIQWVFRVDFLKIDWFDLLVVQGTLKRLLQHHSSKASVHRSSVFFMALLSHLYMATEKKT